MVKRKRFGNPRNSLPTNLIHDEILARLPVKSLLRCRCVSKLWCSIIDDSSFASTYFKKYQHNQEKTCLLVLEPPKMRHSKQICAIRSDEKFRTMSKIGINVTRQEKFQAVGYVNGILCMKRYIKKNQIFKILLWNPSIRKAIDLPFSRFSNEAREVNYDIDCALGYDHVKNDYKVVTSVYVENGHLPRYDMVFTLSSFTWKSANKGRGPCLWNKDGPKVFLNGVIYWGGIYVLTKPNPKGRYSHFVSFNVINDEFKYIDLPDCDHTHVWEYERHPIILDQCVGLLEVFENYSQIWVMEESKDMVHTWTKRFNINLQLLKKCIYFKMDGELLFAGEKGGVKSYNIRKQETKLLANSYKFSPIFVSVFVETLALLKGTPERVSYTFPSNGIIQLD